MESNMYNTFGWLILIGLLFSWLTFGFHWIYSLLIFLAYILFLIGEGAIKRFRREKHIPVGNLVVIIVSFVVSVAVVFGLIYGAKYVMNEIWQVPGGVKGILEIIVILIALYPVKFTFGTIVSKLIKDKEIT